MKTILKISVLILILVVGLGLVRFWMEHNTPQTPPILVAVPMNVQGILKKGISNFDNVSLSDFPEQSYYQRGQFYKGNFYYISSDQILVVNAKHIQTFALSDRSKFNLGCIRDSTVIDHFLYLACYGFDIRTMDNAQNQEGIYVMDLDNGSIIKKYVLKKKNEKLFSNPSITHIGKWLWMGRNDGVLALNTETGVTRQYSGEDLGLFGCNDFQVRGNYREIWVVTSDGYTGCTPGISIYDPSKNKWHSYLEQDFSAFAIQHYPFSISTAEYNQNHIYFSVAMNNGKSSIFLWDERRSRFVKVYDAPSKDWTMDTSGFAYNETLMNPEIAQTTSGNFWAQAESENGKIVQYSYANPNFLYISKIFGNKRYLLTTFPFLGLQAGVYTLTKGGYPQQVAQYGYDKSIPPARFTDLQQTGPSSKALFYVANDEKYAYILDSYELGGTALAENEHNFADFALRVNLKTGVLTDLMPTFSQAHIADFRKIIQDKNRKLTQDGNTIQISATGGIISIDSVKGAMSYIAKTNTSH